MAAPDLSAMAVPGAMIGVRVTPNARRAALEAPEAEGGAVRIAVTVAPERGKATEAARILLAASLGVAKTRLVLIRGEKARDKVFRLD